MKEIRINPKVRPYLPDGYEKILHEMFDEHQKLLITEVFNGGFSGAKVFKVDPTDLAGELQLPAVIKLGPEYLIKQELSAYRSHIASYLPLAIPITGDCLLDNHPTGGLRYHFVGEGVFKFDDLLEYCSKEKSAEVICELLKRQLLPAVERLHKGIDKRETFQMQALYDQVLPPNLTIDPTKKNANDGDPVELTPERVRKILNGQEIGEFYSNSSTLLRDFIVTEIEEKAISQYSLTVNLSLHHITDRPQDSFRIRIEPIGNVQDFEIGKPLRQPIKGTIVQTRKEKLRTELDAMRGVVRVKQDYLELNNNIKLPNPLEKVFDFLQEFIYFPAIGKIHGDLNLHNVLICRDNRTLNFIDFAKARLDHIAHDYLRLETEIVNKLIASLMVKEYANDVALFHSFYVNLHKASISQKEKVTLTDDWLKPELEKPFKILKVIRQEALRYSEGWQEYYTGLFLYLLGSLKFPNLAKDKAPLAKPLAMIGAATLLDLMDKGKPRDTVTPSWPLIPWGAFNPQVIQGMMQSVIGKVQIVPVKLGETVTVKVFSASTSKGETNPINITADSDKQISIQPGFEYLPGFPAKPIQGNMLLEKWPNGDHTWQFTLIDLTQKIPYNIEGVERLGAFDQTIIAAAWWVKHMAKGQPERTFLILVTW